MSESTFETQADDAVVATEAPPRAKGQTEESTRTKRQPPYHVIILNDEDHTFDYVIELLTKIFRHDKTTAETLTWRIHNRGLAIVLTTHREHAELKRDQVLAYGPDPRLQGSPGSLRCYIEPAEDPK